jgi:hypothetical protein
MMVRLVDGMTVDCEASLEIRVSSVRMMVRLVDGMTVDCEASLENPCFVPKKRVLFHFAKNRWMALAAASVCQAAYFYICVIYKSSFTRRTNNKRKNETTMRF